MMKKKTKRVRVRLDFVLTFKDELDSVPHFHPDAALDEGLAAWVRTTHLDDKGAECIAPGARVKVDLDFRKGGDLDGA